MNYHLQLDPDDEHRFAIINLASEPGIYVIHFSDSSQYVGEAVDLRKRWMAYRNAITPEEGERRRAMGDSRQQWTNIRLKARMVAELQSGRSVSVETAFTVDLDNEPLNLADKHERKAAEGIILVRRKRLGIVVHND